MPRRPWPSPLPSPSQSSGTCGRRHGSGNLCACGTSGRRCFRVCILALIVVFRDIITGSDHHLNGEDSEEQNT
jgi:hypothetical protein